MYILILGISKITIIYPDSKRPVHVDSVEFQNQYNVAHVTQLCKFLWGKVEDKMGEYLKR